MNMLAALALLFGRLSLLAVGGVNSTVPQIVRDVVTNRHWFTAAQFVQLYAIANAAPGPNMLIVTIIGARKAGLAGAATATLAMILPAGILVIFASRIWERYRETRWRRIIQAALLPITAGLLLSAACILLRQADTSWRLACFSLLCTALAWRTRLHPLWLLSGGVALGLLLA
jgi:chromate transporter